MHPTVSVMPPPAQSDTSPPLPSVFLVNVSRQAGRKWQGPLADVHNGGNSMIRYSNSLSLSLSVSAACGQNRHLSHDKVALKKAANSSKGLSIHRQGEERRLNAFLLLFFGSSFFLPLTLRLKKEAGDRMNTDKREKPMCPLVLFPPNHNSFFSYHSISLSLNLFPSVSVWLIMGSGGIAGGQHR